MHLLVLGGMVMKGHCPESRHEVNHKASTQVEAAFIKKNNHQQCLTHSPGAQQFVNLLKTLGDFFGGIYNTYIHICMYIFGLCYIYIW